MEGNQRGGDTTAQLGTAPIGGLLLKLALPTVVAQLVNLLYNIVDRIYIGHMPDVGTVALTGVGLCFPVTYLISAFTYLVAQAARPGRPSPWARATTRRRRRSWATASPA